MKYCKKCGQEIGKNKYCGYCGYKKHNKTIKTIVAIICCISIITVGVLSVLKFSNNDTVSDASSNYAFFTEGFTDVKITDEKSAIEAVASVSNVLGITDVDKELKVKSVNTIGDDSFYRMQQYYNDIPVYGKAITVAADKNGNVLALTSNYRKVSADVSIEPTVTEKQLQKSVENYLGKDEISLSVDNDDLVLYETDAGKNVLAYETNVLSRRVLVDANTSEMLFVTGLYNQAVAECGYKDGSFMGTKVSDNEYCLGDDEKGIFIFNADYKETIKKEIYDGKPSYISDEKIAVPMTSTDNYFGNKDEFKSEEYVKAVNMLQYLQSISGFFKNYNKDHDSSIIATINDAFSPDNAFGGYDLLSETTNATIPYDTEYISSITFGKNLCKDLNSHIDTIGHEYTHGINNRHFKSDTDESEAINEAYADIFGELIESFVKQDNDVNWIHGERNMVNPHEYENAEHPYPSSLNDLDKAESYINSDGVKLYYTNANGGEQDFCHFASTIISHCAYLMYEGIDGTQTRKIDKYDLGELWYNSIMLLQDNCSFSQCRNAVELSARIMLKNEELTEEQYKTVVAAFDAVGIENAPFTYTKTVKNQFDLSVLSVEETENVSYELEVIKILKPGPDESECVMEKTSLKGTQSLSLENGIYIIHITDINDKDNISQTISMEIVVNEDAKATDEVVIYTDFTDVITVILDEEQNNGNNLSSSSNFKVGDHVIKFEDKYICTDGKKVFSKESISEKGKVLAEGNIENIMSNGKTIYYTSSNSDCSKYSLYSVNSDGDNLKKIFENKDKIVPVTYVNDCIYYVDSKFENGTLTKYDIINDKHTELAGASTAYAIGDKIYYSMEYVAQNVALIDDNTVESIDINTGKIEEVATSSTLLGCTYTDDALYFTSFSYEYDSNSPNTPYSNQYIYTVDKNNNVTKSNKLPDGLQLSEISNDGEYVMMFGFSGVTDHVYYRYDLKSENKTKMIKNGYAYSQFLQDISSFGDMYFMGYSANSSSNILKILLNRVTPDGGYRCSIDGKKYLEIDGYKNCIVDGYFVTEDLSTYEITENSDKNTTDKISVDEATEIARQKVGGDGYRAVYIENVNYNGEEYYLFSINMKVDDNERFNYTNIGFAIVSLDGEDVQNADYINGQVQVY